jgi:hypothetical protein
MSAQSIPFDPALLAQLACPVCLRSLRLEDASLVCSGCARSYPVVDGIPVLIAKRTEAESYSSDWRPVPGNAL